MSDPKTDDIVKLTPAAGEGKPGEPGHLVNNHKKCPVDPAHEGYEVRNYDQIWRDGDVHCAVCGAFIRDYDAG